MFTFVIACFGAVGTMSRPSFRKLLLVLIFGALAIAPAGVAQDQSSQPPASSQQNPNRQDAPPDAGGPGSDVGPYAIPKKKDEPPPPPPPEKPKKIEGMPDYSIHVDVPVVEVPVMVTTKDGEFISNLKQENFRISEDGAPQKISSFTISEAPITAVLLVEFAAGDYFFMGDILQASYSF